MSKNRIAEQTAEPPNGQAENPDRPLDLAAKKRIAAIDAGISNLQQEMNNLAAQHQQRAAVVQELQREREEWVNGLKALES